MPNSYMIIFTLILSCAIIVGLLFTHLFAGQKVKGLLLAALALFFSTIGYTIATLILTLPWHAYLSNIFFALGVMLFYASTRRMLKQKVTWLEITIAFSTLAILLGFFQFPFPNQMARQITVSTIFIYIIGRLMYLLYKEIKIHHNNLLYGYFALATLIVINQVLRLILIFTGVNNEIIPGTEITYNLAILVVNATVFVAISLFMVISTAVLIRNELVHERKMLEKLSTVDFLTKAPNRRKLIAHLDFLLKKKLPFAVVIADLDGFKKINDTYGHSVGDAVLIEYAKYVAKHLDQHTFVARFGGDEFVFVFTQFTSESDLEKKVIRTIHLDDLVVDDKTYSFTIKSSAGCAMYPQDGTSIAELLKKADDALYIMKTKKDHGLGFYHHLQ